MQMLPNEPSAGPPLPRMFGVRWPWMSTHSGIDSEVDNLKQKKRAEWQAKGYSSDLIEQGLKWAEEWTLGLPGVKVARQVSPEVGREVFRIIYSSSLPIADRWMEVMSK